MTSKEIEDLMNRIGELNHEIDALQAKITPLTTERNAILNKLARSTAFIKATAELTPKP